MHRYSLTTIAWVLAFCSVAVAGDLKVCLVDSAPRIAVSPDLLTPVPPTGGEAAYSGTIRVYLVEPLARWFDNSDTIYNNGFLDFPIVSNINLADGGKQYLTATWDASTTSFDMIWQENIEAIAVVFRTQGVVKDAYPPRGYYFSARYADAAAAAIPGAVGRNQATPPFTHPIFIEEATATW